MRSDTIHITELAEKLAAILPDAAVMHDDCGSDYTRRIFARMTSGPVSMSLRQKGERVTIASGAAASNRYNLHLKDAPSITVDGTKTPEQMAQDIQRRILDKAAPLLAQLDAEIAQHDDRAEKVEATIHTLMEACPALRWQRDTDGLNAKFSAYDAERGSVSGRVNSSGSVVFDHHTSTTPDKAARVIAALMA